MREHSCRLRRPFACLLAACGICLLALAARGRGATGDTYCTGTYSGAVPRAGAPLRFGVDPGIAGSVGGAQLPSTPDDPARDVAMAGALRPPGHVLVVRLNRLFWSGGDALINQFRTMAAKYAQAGLQVELQVRYHPGPGEDGDLAAWQAYVRHVVDVFGPDPNVVAMTITNEVNVTFSPNTSDGGYTLAKDALIQGVEAAHDEALRRGFRQLSFGFTYAYRFSPQADAAFFAYLGSHGGSAFRAALGFVGLDFYPGSVYPPTMAPGDSYRTEAAQALGVVRQCFMPMAGIGAATPIWITENGVPTGADTSEAQQAAALKQLVQAAHDYSGTFNVTDYRWFNLRDSSSSASGSLPGAAATFATDGLLRDDYTPKPAYAAYQQAIAALGQRQSPAVGPIGCRRLRLRVALRHEPRAIRSVKLYVGRRRVAFAHGRALRTVRLTRVPRHAFTARIVLRLAGGRRISYRRRYRVERCRLVPVPRRHRHEPTRRAPTRGRT